MTLIKQTKHSTLLIPFDSYTFSHTIITNNSYQSKRAGEHKPIDKLIFDLQNTSQPVKPPDHNFDSTTT